jgi:hypothetical protein
MPTNRKLLGAAAFSLALAGGGAAGALLGTPNLSGAQDGTEDTTEATTDAAGLRFGEHRGESLATAAEAIGITEDELRAALQAGQSIAQVAEAEGVDVQVVIDALVADATDRLEEAISNLPDRMTEVVNREGLPEHRGPGGPGGRHGFHPRLDGAADAIGITEDELRTALQDGDTIADVDVQAVIDALVADATAHIDEEVAEGDLTEAEAAERKANLEERITALVNGERPERPADAPSADDA